MLTPQEEDVLRKLARDHAPGQVMNPNAGDPERQLTETQYLSSLVRTASVGPMRVLAGLTEGGNQPLDTSAHVNSDGVVLDRVHHVLKWKKERQGNRVKERQEVLSEFYARTGLGRAQSLTMSKDEISRFVEIAERNNQDVFEPVSYVFDEKPEAAPGVQFVDVGN